MQLGTDPEFVFVGPNGLVNCNDYFPRQNNHRHDNPELGGDGHPWTAEIRPPPKETPRGVVAEMKRIFRMHKDALPGNVTWRAGSYFKGKTLGGHIHFGDVVVEENIISALDGVLGQMFTVLEDATEAKQRRATEYGKLGDVRVKPWGFEWRTPASFIVSPEISLGVFALAKACVLEEVNSDPMSIIRLRGKRLRALNDIDRNRYINADRNYVLNRVATIWEIVSRYRYFFTEEGRPLWQNVALLRHVALNYPSWHTDRDILHRWKIRKKTPAAYKKHFNDRKERLPEEGVIDANDAVEMLRARR